MPSTSIVAFAELQEFIDNPLRTYSTGMQMRLAFAIAAHTEPEILLIDEVLTVGDVVFQRQVPAAHCPVQSWRAVRSSWCHTMPL